MERFFLSHSPFTNHILCNILDILDILSPFKPFYPHMVNDRNKVVYWSILTTLLPLPKLYHIHCQGILASEHISFPL